MYRFVASVTVLILGVVALATVAWHRVGAEDASPPYLTEHPLVGAWVLDENADDPTNLQQFIVFAADGTVIGADPAGGDTIGTWQATGPTTAAVTLMAFAPGEGGAFGETIKLRGTVEVASDGQRFTAPYTMEIVGPDGGGSGQAGPLSASGMRIAVEAMGTPVSVPTA